MSNKELDIYREYTDKKIDQIMAELKDINAKVDSFNQFKVKVTVWVTLTATVIFSAFQLLSTVGVG